MAQYAYMRKEIDWAAILIVAVWVGLWFLWPSVRADGTVKAPAPARVICPAGTVAMNQYELPTAWHPSGRSFPGKTAAAGMVSPAMMATRETEPKFLSREAPAQDALCTRLEEAIIGGREHDAPSTVAEVRKVLGVASPTESRAVVTMSESLEKAGFVFPVAKLVEGVQSAGMWSGDVFLRTGAGGRVVHVLIERSTGDEAVDRAILNAAREGYAPGAAAAVEGRARVSVSK